MGLKPNCLQWDSPFGSLVGLAHKVEVLRKRLSIRAGMKILTHCRNKMKPKKERDKEKKQRNQETNKQTKKERRKRKKQAKKDTKKEIKKERRTREELSLQNHGDNVK